jgi:NAD+ diphosphatase
MSAAMPFTGFPIDRAGLKRREAEWIAGRLADPGSDLILLQAGQPVLEMQAAADGSRALLRLSASALGALPDGVPTVFLGLEGDGRAVFAASLPRRFDLETSPLAGLGEPAEMRAAAAGILVGGELALAATAKDLFDWHERHGFCARCGAASEIAEAGWKRVCPSCGAEHFPRTDPVAIMLPVRGDQCFLARNAQRFPRGFVSALAGFIEPGETVEEACAREVMEEAGLRVLSSRIVSNQPWPFPSQLMIGLLAEVAEGDAVLDLDELAEGFWFTRDEARALLSPQGLSFDGVTWRAPPPLAIAHHLITAWIDAQT